MSDALQNQISECIWKTPGQFTQAPSIDCLILHCLSLKSWLDLSSNHVAIVYCANGRSRSGILVACLLKQMGAFERSSSAFDFFCNARYHQTAALTLSVLTDSSTCVFLTGLHQVRSPCLHHHIKPCSTISIC